MLPAQATIAQAGVPRPALSPPQTALKKKQRAAHLMPKLFVENFSEASFQDAIKVGRKAKAFGKPREGREAKALGKLLRNMSTWAKEVAPQYSFAEFIFASQALGTNRSLRPMLANLRLAEFREVNAEFEATPADNSGTSTNESGGQVMAEATPADNSGASTNEGGGQVLAEAPPDELEALGYNAPFGDQWEEEDVMMDRLEMEMDISLRRSAPPPVLTSNTVPP